MLAIVCNKGAYSLNLKRLFNIGIFKYWNLLTYNTKHYDIW